MQRYELFFYYANILIRNFNKKLILDLNQLIILFFLFLRKNFLLIKKFFLFVCVHYINYIENLLFNYFDFAKIWGNIRGFGEKLRILFVGMIKEIV